MELSLIAIFDLIGTVAFAISGAVVGIEKKMDIFGVNVLAVTTACGGGLFRDIVIGNTPPNMFKNPFYVIVSIVTANVIFLNACMNKSKPEKVRRAYNISLVCFDTLGLAAFAVDGLRVGMYAGFGDNSFLLVFLGLVTGVGGGVLRDIMCANMPYVFIKHIYALAAIAGDIILILVYHVTGDIRISMVLGFISIVVLRSAAIIFKWNLPRVNH
ncbi:Uncharacterized membrane protein YeiH [Oribacterium sp. KHPX15]|uniref:trimeric intracellular cation channel family protein n=1 Tax=unclassified Oribacterium TaxID=2629782 RepID=UPI0004E13751|nr:MULTISPECIES: trimeric intracellular cation channel family protein [unclassified Oribacterium]SEA36263.1 Uncharacterized membrane protein YeiH [Oribacterium sp. KHPX15]